MSYYLAVGKRGESYAEKLRDCQSNYIDQALLEAIEELEKLLALGQDDIIVRVVNTRIVERAVHKENVQSVIKRRAPEEDTMRQVLTHMDVHMLMTALAQLIESEKKLEEEYHSYGPPTERLLDMLTAMWNTNGDFTVTLIGNEEHEGFADPPADIVKYAARHTLNLNLRSITVQRVIRVRMSQEEPN